MAGLVYDKDSQKTMAMGFAKGCMTKTLTLRLFMKCYSPSDPHFQQRVLRGKVQSTRIQKSFSILEGKFVKLLRATKETAGLHVLDGHL